MRLQEETFRNLVRLNRTHNVGLKEHLYTSLDCNARRIFWNYTLQMCY